MEEIPGQTPEEQSPEPTPESPRSSWAARHKRLLIAGGAVLSLLLVLALALVFYVRSGRLNRYVGGEIQTALTEYGIRAEIGAFELAWGARTATLRDVKLYNQETGQLIATLDRAEVVVDIPSAYALRLRREVVFKRLDLTNLHAYVEIDEQGQTNFRGLRQPPPTAPGRITFDFSSLVVALNGGALHYDDRARKLAAELGDLQANAQPVPGEPLIDMSFGAGAGTVRYEGRETRVDSLDVGGRLGEAGVDITRFALRSPLGEVTANGRVEDFAALRTNLAVQARVTLDEAARVFAPDTGLQGSAAFDGRVEGEGSRYRVSGALSSDELIAADTLVRGATVEQVNVAIDGDRITFDSGPVRADAVNVQGNQLAGVSASGVSGEAVGGDIHANVRQVTASRVALTDGQIGGVTISNITADVQQDGVTEARAQRVTATQVTLPDTRVEGIALANVTATINGGRTQVRVGQVTASQAVVPQGQINGIALANVAANLEGGRYQVTGGLTIRDGAISGAQLGAARGQLVANNASVALNDFTAAVMGGTATGNAVVQMGRGGASRLTASLADLNTNDLFKVLEVEGAPLAGTLNGQVNITWPGSNVEALSGTLTAQLTGQTTQTEGAIPVTGDVEATARNGVFDVSRLELTTGATNVTATGRLSPEGDSDLQFSVTSTRAAELQTIAYSVKALKESVEAYQPRLAGDFNFTGRITGLLKDPTITGDVNASSIGLREQPLGSLTGRVLVSPAEVAFENGVLAVADGGTANFSYRAPRAELATSGRLDATIDRINAETLMAAAGVLPEREVVTGEVSGEAHLTGLPDSPTGTATVNLTNATVAGQAADVATASLVFDGKTARLERAQVRMSQGEITASGNLDLKTNDFQLQGKADNVDLGQAVASLKVATQVTGTANATFQARGNTADIGELNVEVNAQGQNVTVNGRDAGQLSLTARTSPNGRVDVDLVTGIAGKPQPLRASIELRQPGRPINVEANFTDFDFAPLLAAFAPDLASTIAGVTNGRLRVSGPIQNAQGETSLDGLRGDLTLNTLALQVRGRTINVQTPLVVALNGQQVRLNQTRITGQGIDLSLGGTLGFGEGAGMNFSLTGTAALDSLGEVSPDVFLGGTVAIDARLGGTASDPRLSGEVRLNNVSFEGIDLPVTLQEGNGRIVLDGEQVRLENFTARSNDGAVNASGTMRLAQLQPQEWNFALTANNVNVLYEGALATLNANLTLTGTPDGQVLGGTVNIPEGEYTTNLDIATLAGGGGATGSLSFGGGGAVAGESGAFGFPPINLDVSVQAPNSLLIRNEQVNTVASAALQLTGTVDDPIVTGRVAVEGGTIKLRSQRYEIVTGTLDFPPGGTTPVVNVLTEGDVSGYHVYLGLEGPIDAMDVTLRSDPDLPRSELLSLVATGRTDSSTLGSEDILASGLGTAASLLSEEFISQPAQSLLGLNRFQIDPVLKPNENPAARLTVGKQITRDLAFTYTTNVGSEQDQSVIVEYTLTNRFSGVASYTQGGSSASAGRADSNFTLEVRGRKRFAAGFEPNGVGATGTTTASATPVPPRPERQPLPPADVVVQKPDEVDLSERRIRELVPVETQGFSRPLARLGERNLTNYLQERGYFFATVRSRCEPADCSGTEVRLIYDVQPGQRLDLKDIRIEGTDKIDVGDVSDALQSRKESFFGGVPFLKNLPIIGGLARGITSDDRIRRDRDTIRDRMADLGFRSARVTSRLDPQAGSDDLVLVFTVEEGVRSTVSAIDFRGNAIFPSDELRRALSIDEQDPYSPTQAREGTRRIRELYAGHGFLEATAQYQIAEVGPDQVRVIYDINEGTRAVVSEVAVAGYTKTKESAIRRFLDFKPGQVLTPDAIRRTQRDLFATGAFSEVSIRPALIPGDDPNARRVTVHVTEARPLLFVYGLGFSTDEGVRGLAQVSHTNFLGRINTVSLRLRASGREQLMQLQYTDLRLFGSRWAGTASAFYNRNSNLRTFVQRELVGGGTTTDQQGEGFGVERFVAFLQGERKFSDSTSLRLRYSFERSKLFNAENIPVEEIGRNERAIRLGMFTAGLTRDERDSALNPTRGQLVSAEHSLAARAFGGNEAFNKFFANYQRYRQFPRETPIIRDSVFAFATRVGLGAPYNVRGSGPGGAITDSDRLLPISERFFGGGATTLRGFRFEQAGPQIILEPRNEEELPTLVPIGGDALLVTNFELRYPLTNQLRLVPFYDVGNVFRRVSDMSFKNLTHTIGVGLRFNTPIGPVGVDYGYLLNPPSFRSASGMLLKQPRGVIHIRFGQTF